MKRIISASLIAALLGSTAAFATPASAAPAHRPAQHDTRGPARSDTHRAAQHDARGPARPDMHRFNGRDRADHRVANRGPARPAWRRGEAFHDRDRYVVADWSRYRLRPPPRGYHWVRSGNDFLLVAITSGLIMDLILNSNAGYGYYGYGR